MNDKEKLTLQNQIKDIVITRLLSTVTSQASQILLLKTQCEEYKINNYATIKSAKKTINTNHSNHLSRNCSKLLFEKPPLRWNPSTKWKNITKSKQQSLITLDITKSNDSLYYKSPITKTKTSLIPKDYSISKPNLTKTIQASNSRKIFTRFLRPTPISNRSRTSSAELREDKEKNISVISVKINQSNQPYIFVNKNQTSSSFLENAYQSNRSKKVFTNLKYVIDNSKVAFNS